MCQRKDLGPRCSNQAHQQLISNQNQLEAAQAELRDHEIAYDSGEYADAAEIKKRRNQLANIVARLKGHAALLQANYDATKDGVQNLGEQLQNPELTEGERDKLQQRVKNAIDVRNEWQSQRARSKAQSAKLTSVLFNAGVDDATIAEIQHLASADKKTPHPRSVADYRKSLDLARSNREQLEATQEAEVSALYKQAKQQGWSQDETTNAVDELDRTHVKAMAVSTEKNKRARAAYDSTVEGQMALQTLLEQTPREEYKKKADLRFRISTAEKTRRDGLSDRQARVILKRRITEVMKEHGKNPRVALDALKVKASDISNSKLATEPDQVIKRFQAHITILEQFQIASAFEKSPEFQAGGEKAFNAYARKRLLADPMAKRPKSLDDANAEAEMFDKGIPHRHKSSRAGHREAVQPVYLTVKEKRIISERAKTFHMSRSSYIRAMLTGVNPFAIQNDRSENVNTRKTKAMRKLLNKTVA